MAVAAVAAPAMAAFRALLPWLAKAAPKVGGHLARQKWLYGILGLQGAGMGLGLRETLAGEKTQRLGVELQMEQMMQAAGLGRREEERTNKLIEQLGLLDVEKEARSGIRESRTRRHEMDMATIMSLMNLSQQSTEARQLPTPLPPMSRLSMMR